MSEIKRYQFADAYIGGEVRVRAFVLAADHDAEVARLTALLKKQTEYSIELQRVIEALCRGHELPYPELRHSKMAAQYRADQNALTARLAQAETLLRRLQVLPDTLVEDAEWREARKAWTDVDAFLAASGEQKSSPGTDHAND